MIHNDPGMSMEADSSEGRVPGVDLTCEKGARAAMQSSTAERRSYQGVILCSACSYPRCARLSRGTALAYTHKVISSYQETAQSLRASSPVHLGGCRGQQLPRGCLLPYTALCRDLQNATCAVPCSAIWLAMVISNVDVHGDVVMWAHAAGLVRRTLKFPR